MKAKMLFVVLCIASTIIIAQPKTLTLSNPTMAGFSAERLTRIDKTVQEYINNKWIQGATVLIAKDGKIALYKSYGYNDAEHKKNLDKTAIFRIASQTKAITSVAVMMLYEEGKFLLDDAISKYIPEFNKPNVLDKFNAADTSYTTVAAKREITIRDLLTHTSGIGYAQIGSKEANAIYAKSGVVGGIGVGKIVLADKMKILGKLPLFHQPGEKFTYGLNSDVLGYFVEVMSGMSLDEFFKKKIFQPLGMNDTYFYLPKEKQQRLSNLFTENSNKQVVVIDSIYKLNGDFNSYFPNIDGTYFSGGGGLSSTAMDYSIFLQMLLNGGIYNGKRILSKGIVRLMTMNQIGEIAYTKNNKFGLGFDIMTDKGSARLPLNEGSYSWGGMFSSQYWVDPKEKIVGQIWLQQFPMSHGEIHDKIKVLTYQALNN